MNFEEKLKQLTKPIPGDQLELRIGQGIKAKKGFPLLVYKNSRVDVQRLNEVFGLHWSNKFSDDPNGNVRCAISIYDDEHDKWFTRQDIGEESYTEKLKGSHSDAFKRAGFRWGIGIELYKFPFIWIQWPEKDWYRKGDKHYPRCYPQNWSINIIENDPIILEIHDKKGNLLFANHNKKNYNKPKPTSKPKHKPKSKPKKESYSKAIDKPDLNREPEDIDDLKEYFGELYKYSLYKQFFPKEGFLKAVKKALGFSDYMKATKEHSEIIHGMVNKLIGIINDKDDDNIEEDFDPDTGTVNEDPEDSFLQEECNIGKKKGTLWGDITDKGWLDFMLEKQPNHSEIDKIRALRNMLD